MSDRKYRKLNKDNKLKYSIATYTQKDGENVVDLRELAEKMSRFEMGPEKLNHTRCTEMALLALDYLNYRKNNRQ